MSNDYWTKLNLSRRKLLRSATSSGIAVAALSLVGCGGGSSKTPATPQARPEVLDSTKGKPGGKFILETGSYGGANLAIMKNGNFAFNQLLGFTHSGLLEFRNGRPIVPGTDLTVDPDLARALPEQPPDQVSYVFKLKDAKFHNGRTVTSEDVKYSLERYAFAEDSIFRAQWTWLDKVETPDPQTAVLKTKGPFAYTNLYMAPWATGFIMAKEHEESPAATTKLVGSGPFLWVGTNSPTDTSFRRNPDYFDKPYPYFAELQVFGGADATKQIANFQTRQVHMTYAFTADQRDQIKPARPQAPLFEYQVAAFGLTPRVDQAPFNDKRIRQALSMSIDRKTLRQAVSSGEGEPDQWLSIAAPWWGFRKPSELGAAAKYWNYDPQAAKQLLSAAGQTQPIESQLLHSDSNALGMVDIATLIGTNWRSLGVANIKAVPVTTAQSSSTASIGNFEGMFLQQNTFCNQPNVGVFARAVFFSPPDGVRPPTQNLGHVNDQKLSASVEKQLTQLNLEERKATFRQMEDLLAEEQYSPRLSTLTNTYFIDESVKNAQMSRYGWGGGIGYTKYWWFA